MENSTVIRDFTSNFDAIQQNIILNQFKVDYATILMKIAEKIVAIFKDSAISKPYVLTIHTLKNSYITIKIGTDAGNITLDCKYVTNRSFSFFGVVAGTWPIYNLSTQFVKSTCNLIKSNLEHLLLLQYRRNINFTNLTENIYNELKTYTAPITLNLHSTDTEGVIAATPEFHSNVLTIVRDTTSPTSSSEYITSTTTSAATVYILDDGDQIPSTSSKYEISFSDVISARSRTVWAADHPTDQVLKERCFEQLQILNILTAKNLVFANSSEDNVFSTIFNFFRNSDVFNKKSNNAAYLRNLYRRKVLTPDVDNTEYGTNNIGLLENLDSFNIVDSSTVTNDTAFNVFKFPTLKNQLYIPSATDVKYTLINDGLIQMTTNSNITSVKIISTILIGRLFDRIIGDSSSNTMDSFLERTLGPSFTTNITYEQIYTLFNHIAKLLENIKILSFTIFMKRSSVYPYKYTKFLATTYPEIPFSNNNTDAYYQAVLDSPIFNQTSVKSNKLTTVDTSLDLTNSNRSTMYSNFFEILYSSDVHYARGKTTKPYDLNSKNLIYTTVEAHKESPTFDVYDKNGSNGNFAYFINYDTSTYDLKTQVTNILELFNVKRNSIICQKNILAAFYMLLSKWHENIRSLHCNIFCCHINCHTGQYFQKSSSISDSPSDATIPMNITISYHYYGWSDAKVKDTTITGDAAYQILEDGVVAQMELPKKEVITTWSSSRSRSTNAGYHSYNDQLKINVKFPEYHGSSTGVKVYAEYVIRNYFKVNEEGHDAITGSPLNYGVKIRSPYALLGQDKHEYLDTPVIICEDRIDAKNEISEALTDPSWIHANYYIGMTPAKSTTTDLNFGTAVVDSVPHNTMISCIPLEIDVYYKATFASTPVDTGKYNLEYANFTLKTGYSDIGYVFPDTKNFTTSRKYDGTNATSLTGYTSLGPIVQNRTAAISYFATEFCPSLNIYDCAVRSGEAVGSPTTSLSILYTLAHYGETIPTDVHGQIAKECDIYYSNGNGSAGTVGTITLVAKEDAKVFYGMTTINYTVNVHPPLSLTDSRLSFAFRSEDTQAQDGRTYSTTLKPLLVCTESYGVTPYTINQKILEIEYLPNTIDDTGTLITVNIKPRSDTLGDLYYSGTATKSIYLLPPDDDGKFDLDGMQYLGECKVEGLYGDGDHIGVDSDVIGPIYSQNIPKGQGLYILADCKAIKDTGKKVHTCVGSIQIYVAGIASLGEQFFVVGSASYACRGNKKSSNPDSKHHKHFDAWDGRIGAIIPASNIDELPANTTIYVGLEVVAFDPNYGNTRTVTAQIYYNHINPSGDRPPAESETYEVDFDPRDGIFYGDSGIYVVHIEQGEKIGASMPENPVLDGYTFNGWFTTQVDGVQVTSETVPTSDVTYYAQWTEIPPPEGG